MKTVRQVVRNVVTKDKVNDIVAERDVLKRNAGERSYSFAGQIYVNKFKFCVPFVL
mgnify:CR=1 FL=1